MLSLEDCIALSWLAIKSMIREDIQAAAARGERERVLALQLVLRNYVSERRRLD